MAMRRTCDVCGTANDVARWRVRLDLIPGEDGDPVTVEGSVIDIDLCPRDLERLKAKIKSGTTPPPKRNHKPKEKTT